MEDNVTDHLSPEAKAFWARIANPHPEADTTTPTPVLIAEAREYAELCRQIRHGAASAPDIIDDLCDRLEMLMAFRDITAEGNS